MKKIKLLSILLLTLLKFAVAQQPFVSMGVVVFADGKYYKGKVLDETSDMVRIQFLPSNSIYEFNRLGVITKSTGTYKAGALVKQISVHELVKDIYAEENAVYDYGFIGVRFGDGKLFFALTDGIGYNIVKDAFFSHSGSVYGFIKENGKWKVAFTVGGAYPAGHIITQLYRVQNFGRVFYTDGSFGSSNFMERKPTGNN